MADTDPDLKAPDPVPDRIRSITGLVDSGASLMEMLTGSRVFLTLLLTFGGILMYSLFENRTTVLTAALANPWTLFIFLGGAIVLLIGMSFSNLQKRVYARYDHEIEHLRVQVAELLAENRQLEKEMAEIRGELRQAAREHR